MQALHIFNASIAFLASTWHKKKNLDIVWGNLWASSVPLSARPVCISLPALPVNVVSRHRARRRRSRHSQQQTSRQRAKESLSLFTGHLCGQIFAWFPLHCCSQSPFCSYSWRQQLNIKCRQWSHQSLLPRSGDFYEDAAPKKQQEYRGIQRNTCNVLSLSLCEINKINLQEGGTHQ